MYSRIPRQPPRPAGVPSYRRSVTPPPNYHGNAFPTGDASEEVRPHFDGLPRVSNLPPRDVPPRDIPPTEPTVVPSADESVPEEASAPEVGVRAEGVSEEPQTPEHLRRATLLDRAHFPLGHGLGQEELLLLGLIVLLLHEDRAEGTEPDNDLLLTLIAIGFLLLCG